MFINSRPIGSEAPCFVIAEAGVNHNGAVERAHALIDAAASAGADAVKFQTFAAARLASAAAPLAEYQRTATGEPVTSQLEMLTQLELPKASYPQLMAHAADVGTVFLSTPFDDESADFLDTLGVPAFKVSSGDLTNVPFLRRLARKGRPLLISTGMATLAEVAAAVDAVNGAGASAVGLLHCVSSYPAAAEHANLRAMRTLALAFGCPVGYSDHTEGVDIALASVALGAAVLEKHITLDRTLPGPDHAASLEPSDFQHLVAAVRRVESALGHGRKEPVVDEAPIAAVARKSLAVREDLQPGDILTSERLVALRPGTGIPPSATGFVEGRALRRGVRAGCLLSWDDLA